MTPPQSTGFAAPTDESVAGLVAKKKADAQYSKEWAAANREKCREANRRYRARNQEKERAKSKDWRDNNRHKRKAHDVVYKAVRHGRLIKAEACQTCGSSGPLQAHHTDYSAPLVVEWLCAGCHQQEHARLRAVAQSEGRHHG